MFDLHADATSKAAANTEHARPVGNGPWAGATRSPIQFHFDFISPFGYFASLRIDELARRHGREVEWTSMLLGVSVKGRAVVARLRGGSRRRHSGQATSA
jgi:hypothetical protein